MKSRIALALALPLSGLLYVTACSDNGSSSNDTPPGSVPPETPPGSVAPPDGTDGGDGGPKGPGGSCVVTKPGTAGTLFKSRLLLPESIADGELLIDGSGTILCAGASCATAPPEMAGNSGYAAAYAAATIVTCTDAIISPGLINPHDHITFADVPPQPHGTERYEHRHDWRKGLEGHKKISTTPASGSNGANSTRVAELRFVMSGVTAGATAGGADGLMRNVDGSPAQLEGAKIKIADSQTFPLKDSTPPATWPNLNNCNQWSATRDKNTTVAGYEGYLPHIAEGINPVAELEMSCQTDPADATHDLLAKQTAVIHGVGVTANDIKGFRDSQTALIWSPRSNVDLYGNTAPVALYDNLGVQIALGTDWLPSGSMNMARELKCADSLNKTYFGGHFTDKQLWQMVTINAAFAIGAQNVLATVYHALGIDPEQKLPDFTGRPTQLLDDPKPIEELV